MHVLMATPTEPSNAFQFLFVVPPVPKSYTMHAAGNEMMSRQSETRALAKLTACWNLGITYIIADDGEEEVLEVLFLADY